MAPSAQRIPVQYRTLGRGGVGLTQESVRWWHSFSSSFSSSIPWVCSSSATAMSLVPITCGRTEREHNAHGVPTSPGQDLQCAEPEVLRACTGLQPRLPAAPTGQNLPEYSVAAWQGAACLLLPLLGSSLGELRRGRVVGQRAASSCGDNMGMGLGSVLAAHVLACSLDGSTLGGTFPFEVVLRQLQESAWDRRQGLRHLLPPGNEAAPTLTHWPQGRGFGDNRGQDPVAPPPCCRGWFVPCRTQGGVDAGVGEGAGAEKE